MLCKKCGAEIKEGSKFCAKCGTPVEEVKVVETDVEATRESSQPEEVQSTIDTAKKKPVISIAAGIAALLLVGAVGVGSAFFFGRNSGPEQEETIGSVQYDPEKEERESAENIADKIQSEEPVWVSLTPQYSIPDVPSIDIYASNFTPNEKSQGIVWDSTLFYWLEDVNVNSSEDGYLAQCRITKNLLRNAESGNLIQYEIYHDPNTDEIYKIVSIEQSGDNLQLVDYYYQGGVPNFAFAREDSVYTPTYATPSKTGERYYFNNNVLARWRMVREPGRIEEYVLTSSKVPYSQSNYFNESEDIRVRYDETEMRMLNAAQNTYDAIIDTSPVGAVEGYVVDTAGTPLEGVTVDILNAADNTLLYRGTTASDGTFRILTYLDRTECVVILRETDVYQENNIHGINLAQSGASSCGTILMHRFDGDEYPVHINVYSATDVRGGEDGLPVRELLQGVTAMIRAGVGTKDGEVLQTLQADGSGLINTTLQAGTYTAQIDVPGYATTYLTVEVAEQETAVDGYVLPSVAEGQTGVVLTWDGQVDLDLTLFTPYQSTGGDMAHIGGAVTEDGHGNRLVADNTSGCEVMYINTAESGSYKLYVNNYTDSQAGNYISGTMAVLNIHIYIYDSTGLIAEYIFPVEQVGVVWEVLDISGSQLTPSQRVYSSLAGKTWWLENKWSWTQTSGSWFEDMGLTITPQGDFSYASKVWYSANGSEYILGYYDALINIAITETTNGVADGYKEVRLEQTLDRSNCSEYAQEYGTVSTWNKILVLDRYTGNLFEFENWDEDVGTMEVGETSASEKFRTFTNGNGTYTVTINFQRRNENYIVYDTVTVTCPADYDGLVFAIFDCDYDVLGKGAKLNFEENFYTIDNILDIWDEKYYFSYTNN